MSVVKSIDCKKPRFTNQDTFNETGIYTLDDDLNMIILINDILDDNDVDEYLTNAINVKRISGKSSFGVKPRQEICYTIDGKPYKYSNINHNTEIYPQHVINIINKLTDKFNSFLPFDNEFNELSTGVDILYSNKFPRGGSIGRHADDEYDWGLIIIYSLGQSRYIRIRNNSTSEFTNIKMVHNSLVAMYGSTFQQNYTHQVDKLSVNEKVSSRYSLNIRFK